MKVCTKCGIEKELSKFYVDKSKADKKRPRCKSCENEHTHAYRKTDKYKIVFNP